MNLPAAVSSSNESLTPISIESDSVDNLLLNIGQMVGLLVNDNGSYTLNDAWFSDPVAEISTGFKENADKLPAILAELMGELSGNALGIPVKDPALLGNWYPIKNPDTGKETGLNIVNYGQDKDQIFGFGVMHDWEVAISETSDATDKPVGPTKIVTRAYGLIPLLKVGSGGLDLVLGEADYPISLGALVDSGEAHMIDFGGFSLDGFKVTAEIRFSKDNPFDLSMEIMQLKLPSEEQASDRTLSDLAKLPGKDYLETAVSLFMSALARISNQNDKGKYLLAVIGLSDKVEGTDLKVPVLDWIALASDVSQGGTLPKPMTDWFNALLEDKTSLQNWLTCIAGLAGNTAPEIDGDGSRDNPFGITIYTVDSIGKLQFTIGSMVEKSGVRHLYPGLQFASKGFQPVSSADVALRLVADMELAEFILNQGSIEYEGPSSLNFTMGMVLGNTDLSKPMLAFDDYSFGSLQGGVALAGDLTVVPAFELLNVKTSTSVYERIDLTDPNKLSELAENELFPAIDKAISNLLGLDENNSFGRDVATLVGFKPPTTLPDSESWPFNLPLQSKNLASAVTDPLGAIGDYYAAVLSGSDISGKAPFSYMVADFASVLQQHFTGLPAITVNGDGTELSPWQVELAESSFPVVLQVWQNSADSATDLYFAIAVNPTITLGSTKLVPNIKLVACCLRFAKANSLQVSAQWLPKVSAGIALPDPFKTPPVFDSQFKVDNASLSAAWSTASGWQWDLTATKPTIVINGQDTLIADSLTIDDPDQLKDLVLKQAQTFAPALLGIIGLAIYRSGSRMALAADGIAGLLPNLGSAMPQGVSWPTDMPLLQLTSFDAPAQALQQQLNAIFSSADNAKAALGLLAWAMDSAKDSAPEISGSGSYASPWIMPTPTPFDALTWYDSGNLGLGAQFTLSSTQGEVVIDSQAMVKAASVLLSGSTAAIGATPAFDFNAHISNKSGALIDNSSLKLSVASIDIGWVVAWQKGALTFAPVLTFNDVTFGELKSATISWQDFASASDAAYAQVLYEGINILCQQLKDNATFTKVYDLLGQMNLVMPIGNGNERYAINASGWAALVANPLNFIQQGLLTILADASSRAELFSLVEQITGVTLPKIPGSVLETLYALEFVQSPDLGYAINPPVVLQFFQAPVTTLETQCKSLLSNTERVKQLLGELNPIPEPIDFGPFKLTLDSSGALSVELDKTIALGQLFELSGAVVFNVAQQTLDLKTSFYNQQINFALAPQLSLTLPVTTQQFSADFEVLVTWGAGNKPAGQPLTIYPFDQNTFVSQVAELAPVYALSSFVTGTVEDKLLKDYTAAQVILGGIGMAYQDESKKWLMPALNGLISDPKGWLLSNTVLGADGSFDLAALGKILNNIPEVKSSNGIGFKKITNGVQLYGLPYGIHLNVTEVDDTAVFSSGVTGFSIAGGKANIDNLDLGISLNASYQPSFSGDIAVSGDASLPIKVNTGYDKEFTLSIAQTTDDGISLDLMPFPGWEPLLKQLIKGTAQELLPKLTNTLLTELERKYKDLKPFIDKLRAVSTDLDVKKLLKDITTAIDKASADDVADDIATAALGWLKERFDDANVSKTTDALTAIFADVIDGVTAENGLLLYTPENKLLPITLQAGKANYNDIAQLGVWVQVHAPNTGVISLGISPTGIGISLADNTVEYSFGIAAHAPIGLDPGPALNFGFSAKDKQLQLYFDPLGDDGSLKRELYPQFFPNDSGTTEQAILSWLELIVIQVLPRYISIAVLNTSSVKKWLTDALFDDGPSAADVLVASKLLVKEVEGDETQYALNSLKALQEITPDAFVANFLKTLLGETEIKVLPVKGGGVYIGNVTDVKGEYGIRVQIPDIKVGSNAIQLGAEDIGWIDRAGGEVTNPGISVSMPIDDAPEFDKIAINFVNIGLDLNGKGNANLIDLSRFSLNSIKPRIYLSLDFADNDIVTFGAGAEAYGIAISLAPNTTAAGDGGNPIAANILGSGSKAAQPSKQADNPPVDPSFTIRAGYIEKLSIELLDPQGDPAKEVWIPVQRSFGPIHANKIGMGIDETPKSILLDLLFDGSIGLAGLLVQLQELSVGIPVETPTDYGAYKFDLQGMDISYKGGAVAMSAGLLRSQDTPTDPIIYTGLASLKAGTFAISALGSYAEVKDASGNNEPSLFVFGQLQTPLGGVPAFFVNGVAAGFSYNRDLALPDITGVQSFPLVQVGNFSSNSPDDALEELKDVVKPVIGEYWVAAGIQGTSFELIDTELLMFVKFGKSFQIDILGLSKMSLPKAFNKSKNNDMSTKLAYAELALKASIRPDDGVVSVEAQLTPNSFVLDKNCRLTGGFAFYLWYSGANAGQFVISLGGYNSAFQKPDFYPDVPRVGFSWPVSSEVSIKGGTYFAMTPIAIMAGGNLQATFKAGPIKAWFDAGANFMIAWEPFYFTADIHVVVGASFTLKIAGVKATISAQIGAGLALWGPPTGGKVLVDWTVISFTIPFGSSINTASDKPLSWPAFQQQFLPAGDGDDKKSEATPAALIRSSAEDDSDDDNNVIKFNYAAGLVPASSKNPSSTEIQLQSGRFVIELSSVIPFTTLTALEDNSLTGKAMGIRPMQSNKIESLGTVTLSYTDGSSSVPIKFSDTSLTIPGLTNGAPGALWSNKNFDPDAVPDSADMTINNALMGISIEALTPLYLGKIGPFDLLKAFETESLKDLNLPFDDTPNYQPGDAPPQQDQLKVLMETLMAPSVIATRNQYLQSLADSGFIAPLNPDLNIMAKFALDILVAPPVLAAPGQYVVDATVPVTADPPELATSSRAEVKPVAAPKLLASTWRYKTGENSDSTTDALLPRDYSTSCHCIQCPKTLSALTRKQDGSSGSGLLNTGATQLWQLDKNANKHTVALEGSRPVRVSCYSPEHHLLSQQDHEPGSHIELPKDTDRVTLKALADAGDENTVCGWLRSSQIFKVNPYYYQSGDVMIRPQCSSPIRENRSVLTQGYIIANRVLQENLVRGADGSLIPGCVQTLFNGDVRTVGVLLTESAEVEFEYAFKQQPESIVKYAALEADVNIPLSGGKLLMFNIPIPELQANHLSIQTRTAQSNELLGVLGSRLAEKDLRNKWSQQYLYQHSMDLDDDEPQVQSAVVTLKSDKEQ